MVYFRGKRSLLGMQACVFPLRGPHFFWNGIKGRGSRFIAVNKQLHTLAVPESVESGQGFAAVAVVV